MAKNPITELPAEYAEVQHVVLTEPRLLLFLNFLGIAPIAVSYTHLTLPTNREV